MEFCELTFEELDSFIKTYDRRSFWQTSIMAKFQEAQGRKVYAVGAKDKGTVVAASLLVFLPMKFGKYKVNITRGFCINYDNKELLRYFSSEVRRFAKAQGGMYIEMTPYFPVYQRDLDGKEIEGGFDYSERVEFLKSIGYRHKGYVSGYDDSDCRWIYCLDLEGKDMDTLFKETTRKAVRTDINSIQKRGLHVRKMEKEDLPIFEKMMDETSNRQEFSSREDGFYESFYTYINSILEGVIVEMHVDEYYENTKKRYDDLVFERNEVQKKMENAPENVRHQKKYRVLSDEVEVEVKNLENIKKLKVEHGSIIPLSTGIFITYGFEIIYLFGASYDEFFKYGGPTAMQWHMIEKAKELGCSRYNFYGISGFFEKDQEGYGVYYFKRGFGGYVEELPGDFNMVLTPVYYGYQLLKKLSGFISKK